MSPSGAAASKTVASARIVTVKLWVADPAALLAVTVTGAAPSGAVAANSTSPEPAWIVAPAGAVSSA
jgi:hypothetical protein